MTMEQGDGEEEEEEEEWTGDPNNRPIWKFPVVSRVRGMVRAVFYLAEACGNTIPFSQIERSHRLLETPHCLCGPKTLQIILPHLQVFR